MCGVVMRTCAEKSWLEVRDGQLQVSDCVWERVPVIAVAVNDDEEESIVVMLLFEDVATHSLSNAHSISICPPA